MNRHKFILFMGAAIACVGCCALPLYALVTGVISLSTLGALFASDFMEVLICLAPLILIAGYLLYRRHQQKRCCPAPDDKCADSQCSLKQSQNR